jgi:hypothetical protein
MTTETSFKLNDLEGLKKLTDVQECLPLYFYIRHSSQPKDQEPKKIPGVIKYISPNGEMIHISDPTSKYTNGETVYAAHIVGIGFPTFRTVNKFEVERYISNENNPGEGVLEGKMFWGIV